MLGRIDPNFNPSSIGGQGALVNDFLKRGSSGKAPSYMTTTNADMTGTAAPSSPKVVFFLVCLVS